MALKFSSGLKAHILSAGSLKGALDDGVIDIRSGVKPASPDDPATGSLLGLVTLNAGAFTPGDALNGLVFGVDTDGKLIIPAAAVWRMVGIANGVATWFRFKGNAADDDTLSTTLIRMDGTIAQSGGDLLISNTTIVISEPHTVDKFTVGVDN